MMVSTLRPPPRSHKKKGNKTSSNTTNSSPLRNGTTTNKGKKRKQQSSSLNSSEHVASLYTEDIGMVGVKKAKSTTTPTGTGPILKAPECQKFQISETAEEKLRRLRRKARFDAEGGPVKKKAPKVTNHTRPSFSLALSKSSETKKAASKEPDFLSRALSSGRKDGGRSSHMSTSKRNSYSTSTNKGDKLIGTNQELEKSYLRLTTYPKPENVRPFEVLVKSLAHIKNKYYQEEDFEWANEQLKSVRQDITVQRLKGRFVLDVYETHARILLEHGDLAEFNQCQTMIRYLTTTGIEHDEGQEDLLAGDSMKGLGDDGGGGGGGGDKEVLQQTEEASDEFRAYHVLYALVQNSWDDLTKAMVRVRALIREKDENCCKTASGRHSLEVVKAVTHNDYRAFFKLYESAPHMSAYLMDFLVKRMREKAYERIIAAYRPTICVEYFRGALYFQDLEETRVFLRQMGAKFVKGNNPPLWVDCKASSSSK